MIGPVSRPAAALSAVVLALVLAVGATPVRQQPSVPSAASVAVGDRTPVGAADPSPVPVPAHPAPQPGSAEPVDCSKAKCIALTFDDGPVRQTAALLDVLKAREAHATFFVLGSMARKRPAILRRMLAEGQAIGNHSWNHPQFFTMSSKAVRKQIRRTDAVIRKATGHAAALMRPPFGEQNARIRKAVRGFGDPVILWSIDTQDWKYRNTKRLVSYVTHHAKRNAIVLMHDIRPTTRAAVPAIVEKLQAKGFTLVTVPELLRGRLRAGHVYTHG
jgi:peptidoglycan/xylan/chitin deacetylase (PgdA/CDA1 family)